MIFSIPCEINSCGAQTAETNHLDLTIFNHYLAFIIRRKHDVLRIILLLYHLKGVMSKL